jgi:hypothetical protein
VASQILSVGAFYHFGISQYLWAKLFQTETIRKFQMDVPNEISAGDDVAVTYFTILNEEKIQVIEEAGYHYVQQPTSICHRLEKTEREQCQNLITYLKKKSSESQYCDILWQQVQRYEKLLFLTRDIGIFDEGKDCIFTPFGGIPRSSKVIIYGAGAIGRSVAAYVSQISEIELIGWVDQVERFSWREGRSVVAPSQFDWEGPFDIVLIAVLSQLQVEQIRRRLLDRKIPESKIRYLTREFLEGGVRAQA